MVNMAQFFLTVKKTFEENNVLNYPLGMFQVWFIRAIGFYWDFVVFFFLPWQVLSFALADSLDVALASLCISSILKELRICFSSCFHSANFIICFVSSSERRAALADSIQIAFSG